jgi:hypothetical protein
MGAAHVTETQALIEFRAKLCTFGDEARQALGIIEHEIRRTLALLDERHRHWQAAVRQAEDELIQVKLEYNRRRNERIGDRRPDTSQQEKALRAAEARLEYAQEKLAAARRWQRDLPREVLDYEGPARQLAGALDAELPRMLAFMENKIAALETYAQA